jgi:hypothetical protein
MEKQLAACFLGEQVPQLLTLAPSLEGNKLLEAALRAFQICRNFFHKLGASRRRSQLRREWLPCWRQRGSLRSDSEK